MSFFNSDVVSRDDRDPELKEIIGMSFSLLDKEKTLSCCTARETPPSRSFIYDYLYQMTPRQRR